MDLTLQRRHKQTCPDRSKGPHYLKCKGKCKLWAYGCEDNRKEYFSLKTSDLARAARRLAELQTQGLKADPAKTVTSAIADYLTHKSDKAPETVRKYRRILSTLQAYCDQHRLTTLPQVTLSALDAYVHQYRAKTVSWYKHVEVLRGFWKHATLRKWCADNPAALITLPELEQKEEIEPYARPEVAAMISACDRVGRAPYERLRARAMVLLLRYTGMRISDVVTLSREHVQAGYIVKRAIKNHKLLRIKIPEVVQQALDNLPHPKQAARESRMYFAGQGTMPSLRKGAERLLWSVFDLAGVPGAYPHRFRHTFASELLANGTPIEVVADLLGDSVAIVRKHYQKWMPELQARKDAASGLLVAEPATNVRQDQFYKQ